MSSRQIEPASIHLTAQNIGGISETEVEFTPGVTVLKGRNATNRTSLLNAIMAACGCTNVSIKGDAEQATVSLTVGGENYERRLTRKSGSIVSTGEGFLDDPTVATLFAFLLESNEARRAVARGDNLREIIMRPVDTSAIQTEISQLEARKRQLGDRIDELEGREDELPELERRRKTLEGEIEETEGELQRVEAEIDAKATDIEAEREEQQEVEKKLAKLRELRGQLDDVRYDEETERESIDSLREERTELDAELEDLPKPGEIDVQSVEDKLVQIRKKRQLVERKITELNTVVQFNTEMLDGSKTQVRHSLDEARGDDEDESVTTQLLEDGETVTCWTCGSTVQSDKIEQTVDLLKELRAQTAQQKDEVQAEIDELESQKDDLEKQYQQRTELERRIERIEDELEEANASLESLHDQREELEKEIEMASEIVEELRDESRSDMLDLHEEANDLEYELGRLQNERDLVLAKIDDIESELNQVDNLKGERQEARSQLVDLRTKIEQIQEEAIEEFNTHMSTVLDLLEYQSFDRIWIERTEAKVKEGRRTTMKPTFDLHIVRYSETGHSYEDSIAHLSESEREVVGLVFALAGYLVHDVHEQCPFILLDSLEALDSDRIARLVTYLEEYSEYLVVALLPEDAAALDASYERLTEI